MVEMERESHRMKVISALEDEFAAVDAAGNLSYVPAGRYGDQILQMARLCDTAAEIEAMRIRNRDGLQRFWAKHMGDALQVKKALEAIAAEKSKVPA
jgi:ABC-type molybdate transport system substrate-binding protein